MRAPKKAVKLVKSTGRKVRDTASDIYTESGVEDLVDSTIEIVDDVGSEILDTVSDFFGLED